MSLFDDEIQTAFPDMMLSMGSAVFVRGNEYRAIILDEEFEDETGMRRDIIMTVERTVAENLNKDDDVLIPGRQQLLNGQKISLDSDTRAYKIKYIPKLDQPVIDVVLKRVA